MKFPPRHPERSRGIWLFIFSPAIHCGVFYYQVVIARFLCHCGVFSFRSSLRWACPSGASDKAISLQNWTLVIRYWIFIRHAPFNSRRKSKAFPNFQLNWPQSTQRAQRNKTINQLSIINIEDPDPSGIISLRHRHAECATCPIGNYLPRREVSTRDWRKPEEFNIRMGSPKDTLRRKTCWSYNALSKKMLQINRYVPGLSRNLFWLVLNFIKVDNGLCLP